MNKKILIVFSAAAVLVVGIVLVLTLGPKSISDVNLSGTVRDSITLRLMKDVTVKCDEIEVKTDELGRFAFTHLANGEHTIIASFTGYENSSYVNHIIRGDAFLEITLSPQAANTDKPKSSLGNIKPMPTPPPLPGTPVTIKPDIKFMKDYSNCKIVYHIGGLEVNASGGMEINTSGGVIKQTTFSPSSNSNTDQIIAGDVLYVQVDQNTWLANRFADINTFLEQTSPLVGVKTIMDVLSQVLRQQDTVINYIDNTTLTGLKCKRYYISGQGSSESIRFQGEAIVYDEGQYKGTVIGIDAIVTNNDQGNRNKLTISEIGKIPPIHIPKVDKINDLPPMQQPIKKVEPTAPQKNP